ncbi:AsmA family protein [Temperatibacter marinus]|uniref:AsmA family protein n=1 Tax=Temperatibacter marinus TaxID=1456591 RepID=A0AA52EDQ9_9PROT|nr:AsmA family protein [Temperatibacter marinus]WND02835.1 AsmA family protein [Temperatibacter marinus]
MKVRIRHIIGMTIVLAIAGALLLPSLINWNSYRDVIENLMQEQLGSRVTLSGDIQATLLPYPRITANDVKVEVVGNVKAIDMLLAPVPLLQGDIIPVDMTLTGAKVSVQEQENGKWTLGDVEETVGEQSFISPALGRLKISNSTISFVTLSNYVQQIAIRSLTFEEREDTNSKTITALILTNDVPITLAAKFQPVGTMGNMSARLEAGLPGGRLLFSGRVNNQFHPLLGRISFKGDRLDTAVNNLLDVTAQSATLAGASVPFDFDLRVEQEADIFRAKSFAFSLIDTPGSASFEYSANKGLSGQVKFGVIDLPMLSGFSLSVEEQLNHALKSVSLDVLVQGLQGEEETLKQLSMQLVLSGDQIEITAFKALLPGVTDLSLDGHYHLVDENFKGNLSLQSADAKSFFGWIGVEGIEQVEAGRLATFEIYNTALEVAKNSWQLSDVNGLLDATKFKGHASGDRQEKTLQHLDISLDSLNFDPYMTTLFTEKIGLEKRLGLLPHSFNFKTDRLYFEGRKYEKVKVIAERQQSQIKIDRLSMDIEGEGQVSLAGLIDISGEKKAPVDVHFQSSNLKPSFVKTYMPLAPLFGQIFIPGADYTGENLSFSASLTGDYDKASLALNISSTEGDLTLTGDVIGGTSFLDYSLEGKWKQTDIRQQLSGLRLQGLHAGVAANLSLNLNKKGAVVSGAAVGHISDVPVDITYSKEADQLSGQLNIGAFKPTQFFGRKWGEALPFIEASVSSLSTDFLYQNNTLSIMNLKAAAASYELSGEGDVMVPQSGQAQYNLTLNFDRLDVYPVGFSAEDGGEFSAKPFTEITLPFLKGYAAVTAKNVRLFGQRFDTLSFKVEQSVQHNLTKAELAIVDFKAERVGLDDYVEATFLYQINKKERAFDVTVKDPTFETVSSFQNASPFIGTTLDLNVSLKGSGSSPHALVSSLKGSINFAATQGEVSGFDLGALSWAARTEAEYAQYLSKSKQWHMLGNTDFERLKTSMIVDGGVALLEEASITGGWGTLSGSGQVNLAALTTTMAGKVKFGALPETVTLEGSASGSLARPVVRVNSQILDAFVLDRVQQDRRSKIREVLSQTKGLSPVMMVFQAILPSLRQKQKIYLEAMKQQLRDAPVSKEDSAVSEEGSADPVVGSDH